jgi:hypothetical protein
MAFGSAFVVANSVRPRRFTETPTALGTADIVPVPSRRRFRAQAKPDVVCCNERLGPGQGAEQESSRPQEPAPSGRRVARSRRPSPRRRPSWAHIRGKGPSAVIRRPFRGNASARVQRQCALRAPESIRAELLMSLVLRS